MNSDQDQNKGQNKGQDQDLRSGSLTGSGFQIRIMIWIKTRIWIKTLDQDKEQGKNLYKDNDKD